MTFGLDAVQKEKINVLSPIHLYAQNTAGILFEIEISFDLNHFHFFNDILCSFLCLGFIIINAFTHDFHPSAFICISKTRGHHMTMDIGAQMVPKL